MKHLVGVAEMKTADQPGDIIVTHALGSCLGLAVHDPEVPVGGILHVMLPSARVNPKKAENVPYMFLDTGAPLFFRSLYALGAKKDRIVVKVAGGATVGGQNGCFFDIGMRNVIMLHKLLWKNKIKIAHMETGGVFTRTLYLEIGSGKTWLECNHREWEI